MAVVDKDPRSEKILLMLREHEARWLDEAIASTGLSVSAWMCIVVSAAAGRRVELSPRANGRRPLERSGNVQVGVLVSPAVKAFYEAKVANAPIKVGTLVREVALVAADEPGAVERQQMNAAARRAHRRLVK